MTFNDNAQLDTSRIGGGGGGGGRGGMVIGGGGGILGVIALILYMIFGHGGGGTDQGTSDTGSGNVQGSSNQLSAQRMAGAGNVSTADFSKCKTGADANRDDECLVIGTENSLYNYWTKKFPESTAKKTPWQPPKVIIYSGQTESGCGTASNQVGPFYCPLDKQIYIDASFYDLLTKRFGSSGGPLAKEYVVAHEYGHAVEDQLGVIGEAQKDPQGPESGSVRIELMADCFAGMWAKNASTTTDKGGQNLIKPLTQNDINAALSAAASVGDDTIMKKTQGRVTPEKFTHGTSEQRQRWFMTGYNNENINSCNTLKANPL